MLWTIGMKRNIESFFLLSQPYIQDSNTSFLGLKKAYKKFLHHIQPSVPISSLDEIEFLTDTSRTKKMISLFAEKSRLDDFDRIFLDNSQFQNEQLIVAERHLQKLKEVDEQLFSLFSLVINIIFSGPSELASGGSSSGAIGCIWINPRLTWDSQDFLEFFIHEMTHNLVFLDEYRYHHYENYTGMFLEENYAMSAILAKKRPLDKVFHSILVSTEVLLARQNLLGHPESPKLHPPTSIMLDKAFESIDYVEKNSMVYSLLTPRGEELIKTCKEHLKDIKTSFILSKRLAAVSNFDNATITSNFID